ncbi:MAG: UvrD-helicase domain-containing protein [Patescibacteria group bacterium]
MSEFLQGLNDQQAEAVKTTEGPVLVIAGAGSGKTKTLTHRLAYLISEKGVKPHQILSVTFTNKSAQAMRERAAKLLKANPKTWQTWQGFGAGPVLGTFHSICVRILREESEKLGFKRQFAIYDSEDQKNVVKKVMYNQGISPREVNPNIILSMISRAKNELLTPSQMAEQADGPFADTAAALYEGYIAYLKDNQAMDFDDLLGFTVELFRKHPKVLEAYQKRWPYIMVDEYQDTNHVQYAWANMLAGKNKNLFVVGDDWQGIYSWRGATIRNILEFAKDYKGAKIILLEQNYRSTPEIVELGNAIIAGNGGQMKKTLWTDQSAGEPAEVWQVFDEDREAEKVLEKIAELEKLQVSSYEIRDEEKKKKDAQDITYDYEAEGSLPSGALAKGGILDKIMAGFKKGQKKYHGKDEKMFGARGVPLDIGKQPVKWNQYAVLYRTNAQSRILEEVMLRYAVPYRLVGGIRFYERKEIKDTLAYLRFLMNPNDILSLERIINEPARGIGNKTLVSVYTEAKANNANVVDFVLEVEKIDGLSPARLQAFKTFAAIFSDAQNNMPNLTIDEMIDLLLKRSGYIESLKAEGDFGDERLENISELKSVAARFAKLRGYEALEAFLAEVALVSDQDSYNPENGEAITLMTLHSAKGLEFDVVFLAGMEEGLLPHANSVIEPAQLEEERRLCYVGITRARKRLYFLLTRQRTIYGGLNITTPSRFLAELGEGKVKYFNEDI